MNVQIALKRLLGGLSSRKKKDYQVLCGVRDKMKE
jgi:hypothetical protein